jgi:hypothetical protein
LGPDGPREGAAGEGEPAAEDLEHAEKWRESIDADHGAPTGPGTPPRYFDGTPFLAAEAVLEKIINAIINWLKNHLPELTKAR